MSGDNWLFLICGLLCGAIAMRLALAQRKSRPADFETLLHANPRDKGQAHFEPSQFGSMAEEDSRFIDTLVEVAADATSPHDSPPYGEATSTSLRTERLHAVFDLSPDGFVVLDEEDFVTIVNPAFERLTGLSAIEMVGRHRQILEAMLRQRCIANAHAAGHERPAFIDTQPVGVEALAPHIPSDVLHLVPPYSRTLLRRVRKGVRGMRETVIYFRDITRELEIDRMKSEFLSTAAHELRTPMTSIYGFTELLMRRRFDETRRHEMLATVHRQAGILVNLVNELLDLARIESRRGADFKREVHGLQGIVMAAVDGLMLQDDPRRPVVVLRNDPVHVNVDREKILLALTNVLANAFKYSPAGGDVDVDLVDRRRNERREVGVRVTDRGVGMSKEHAARMFERFFRADSSGAIPGTGLGMSIAKEVVELQGGEIEVASRLGKGTSVTLWLPVSVQRAT